MLKIIPNVRGINFNPTAQEIAWYEEIQEIIFRLKAGSNVLNRSLLGSIDVYKEGLLVGQVPISITISHAIEPVEFAKEISKIFEQLFVSYSRKDAPIVDTNIRRVIQRLFNIQGNSLRAPAKKHIWQIAEAMIPQGNAYTFNQAIMDFGALVCVARNPHCQTCFMKERCRFLSDACS